MALHAETRTASLDGAVPNIHSYHFRLRIDGHVSRRASSRAATVRNPSRNDRSPGPAYRALAAHPTGFAQPLRPLIGASSGRLHGPAGRQI